LHLVNRGTQTSVERPLLDPWFVASAALEGRAHPFVLVNPDAGDHAAERISFGGNPQADQDWPVKKLEYKSADGETTEMELAFTFADYALLMPALHDHFRTVPPGFESEDLVAIDQYLTLDEHAAERHVPYVWGIDDRGILLRLVVSRALVFACRDRLNYWRTLQELAGIHNFYVEAAIERVIEEQRATDALEREQLQQAHAEELDNVRSAAAGETIGRLVEVLMGADLPQTDGGSLATMPAGAPAVSDTPVEPVAEDKTEPVAEDDTEAVADDEAAGDDDASSFGGPWLDTAMCTTCDDCMGINKMMFAYNDDKQAVLTDPKAGTFADLVAAAEICPAKCIHPGDPLDPSEPGLKALVARARPFN
jgi:ferredoxin